MRVQKMQWLNQSSFLAHKGVQMCSWALEVQCKGEFGWLAKQATKPLLAQWYNWEDTAKEDFAKQYS